MGIGISFIGLAFLYMGVCAIKDKAFGSVRTGSQPFLIRGLPAIILGSIFVLMGLMMIVGPFI